MVTVVFADVVGFTSRSERIDIEDVGALLEPYHRLVREEVAAHGGAVAKFIGDGVMALFGAPTAHEDDPLRAVRAALAVQAGVLVLRQDEPHNDLRCRIGIATGEVLVRLAADGTVDALGDVVNTSARLESAAPVDGVLVDEATRMMTARRVAYGAEVAVDAKGKALRVRAWPATADRVVAATPAQRSRIVGREPLCRRLYGIAAATAEGAGPRTIALIGVPGIGKSRLIDELIEDVAGLDATCLRGAVQPYGATGAFAAFGEMVADFASVAEGDEPAVVEETLRAAVEKVVSDAENQGWVVDHLLPLFDGGTRFARSSDEAFSAWRRLVEALATRAPVVAVFEDLHWADEALLRFVEHLSRWCRQTRLLIVCTARPELVHDRPDAAEALGAELIEVPPLSERDIAKLLDVRTADEPLSADAILTLVEYAGGNPLYAVEFASMLRDQDGSSRASGIALPRSVHAVIAARLDAAGLAEKDLLQSASILGQSIDVDALAHVVSVERSAVESRLSALVDRQFLVTVGTDEYAFAHALIRDVAYAGLLRPARVEGHLRAARWIEGRPAGGAHVEGLAHHYWSAHELRVAMGATPDPDLDALTRNAMRAAGDRSYSLGAIVASADYYAKALASGEGDPRGTAVLQLLYGRAEMRARGDADGRCRAAVLDAHQVLESEGDLALLAEAEALLGGLAGVHGDGAEARARHRSAYALAIRLPAGQSRAHVLNDVAGYWFVNGDNDRAVPIARDAVAAASAIGDDQLRGKALAIQGTADAHSSHPTGNGRVILEQAIDLLVGVNSIEQISANTYLGVLQSEDGNLAGYIATCERTAAAVERFGVPRMHDQLAVCRMEADFWRGAWDAVLECMGSLSDRYDRVFGGWLASRIRWARGDRDGAMRHRS